MFWNLSGLFDIGTIKGLSEDYIRIIQGRYRDDMGRSWLQIRTPREILSRGRPFSSNVAFTLARTAIFGVFGETSRGLELGGLAGYSAEVGQMDVRFGSLGNDPRAFI